MKLVLGSQSQGRKSVLEKMGYDFEIVVAESTVVCVLNTNFSASFSDHL